MKYLLALLLLLLLLSVEGGTRRQGGSTAKPTKSAPKKSKPKKAAPSSLSAADSSEDPRDIQAFILEEANRSSQKYLDVCFSPNSSWPSGRGSALTSTPSLGYVTPWNTNGKKWAVEYASKFTHISPVWYILREKQGEVGIELVGEHEYDGEWLESIKGAAAQACRGDSKKKQCKARTMVVPRISWEISQLSSMDQIGEIISLIASEVLSKQYDGFVFEIPIMGENVLNLIKMICQSVKEAFKQYSYSPQIILVLPPHLGIGNIVITPESLQDLSYSVDLFSIMTYDYSKGEAEGGPNSPLRWLEEVVEGLAPADRFGSEEMRKKLLIGLPFYGYKYIKSTSVQSQAVVAHEVKDMLTSDYTFRSYWDAKTDEQFFHHEDTVSKKSVLFTYPTPAFVQKRIELMNKLGVGMSVWELGQGTECLLEML